MVINGVFAIALESKVLPLRERKVSADIVSADEFVSSVNELTNGYSLDQVFNGDETGLFYKILPGPTLTTIHSDPRGPKKLRSV